MVTSRHRWIGGGAVIRHPLAKGVFLPFELAALGLLLWKLCSDRHAKFYSECESKSSFSALVGSNSNWTKTLLRWACRSTSQNFSTAHSSSFALAVPPPTARGVCLIATFPPDRRVAVLTSGMRGGARIRRMRSHPTRATTAGTLTL